ncbi:MAG TPA: hypothetical protein VK604_27995 [Bryobacteraceae bacterium]|nr:hypothetical protein [Bryobacteraceae bacterium]
MRQAVELTGPGASLEEVAAALGATPKTAGARLRTAANVHPQRKSVA